MESIDNILRNHRIIRSKGRKLNTQWEIADEFGKYVNVPVIIVLKLFKKYGEMKVLALRSWLRDLEVKPGHKDKTGLLIWKLKNG